MIPAPGPPHGPRYRDRDSPPADGFPTAGFPTADDPPPARTAPGPGADGSPVTASDGPGEDAPAAALTPDDPPNGPGAPARRPDLPVAEPARGTGRTDAFSVPSSPALTTLGSASRTVVFLVCAEKCQKSHVFFFSARVITRSVTVAPAPVRNGGTVRSRPWRGRGERVLRHRCPVEDRRRRGASGRGPPWSRQARAERFRRAGRRTTENRGPGPVRATPARGLCPYPRAQVEDLMAEVSALHVPAARRTSRIRRRVLPARSAPAGKAVVW
ncbi:hypothetical protein ABH917_001296 [Thermobifida halotolerans]